MLTVRVRETYKNGNGTIIYRIQDIRTRQIKDVTMEQLKFAIANKQCAVTNFTLTSDGRLVEHKENTTTQKENKPAKKSKEELLKIVYNELLKSPVAKDAERISINRGCIEGRFFTGCNNWYSEEQEREMGYTCDVCDADILNDKGEKVLIEFFQYIKKKYNIKLDWSNYGEKAYSGIFIV